MSVLARARASLAAAASGKTRKKRAQTSLPASRPVSDSGPDFYRAATVCRIVGIKPITLRQWHLRNLYTPFVDREGWRAYSFDDLVLVSIAVHLIGLGITTERALMIARESVSELEGYTICFEPMPPTGSETEEYRAVNAALTNGVRLDKVAEHIRRRSREPRPANYRREVALLIDVEAIKAEIRRKLEEGEGLGDQP